MSDPCPDCDAPLKGGNSFCPECGYDVELTVADYRGEGTELPDDDYDYEETLRREGLAGGGVGKGKPWPVLLAVALMLAAMIAMIVMR